MVDFSGTDLMSDKLLTPQKALNKAYRQQKVERAEI